MREALRALKNQGKPYGEQVSGILIDAQAEEIGGVVVAKVDAEVAPEGT